MIIIIVFFTFYASNPVFVCMCMCLHGVGLFMDCNINININSNQKRYISENYKHDENLTCDLYTSFIQPLVRSFILSVDLEKCIKMENDLKVINL